MPFRSQPLGEITLRKSSTLLASHSLSPNKLQRKLISAAAYCTATKSLSPMKRETIMLLCSSEARTVLNKASLTSSLPLTCSIFLTQCASVVPGSWNPRSLRSHLVQTEEMSVCFLWELSLEDQKLHWSRCICRLSALTNSIFKHNFISCKKSE